LTWFSQYTEVEVENTITETTLVGTGFGTATLPANHLIQGSTYRITASGVYADNFGNLSAIRWRVKIGGIELVTDEAINYSFADQITDRPWHLQCQVVIASTSGTTSQARIQGVFNYTNFAGAEVVIPIWSTVTTSITDNNTTRDISVTADMAVATEETFGPLAPVFRFETDAQVIEAANATRFGLAAYFYGQNLGRVFRLAEALEYGMVGINTGILSTEVAPFGGVKESGIGREGSKYGLDEYLETKYLCIGI
jgi:hypothetical protein